MKFGHNLMKNFLLYIYISSSLKYIDKTQEQIDPVAEQNRKIIAPLIKKKIYCYLYN